MYIFVKVNIQGSCAEENWDRFEDTLVQNKSR